MRSLPVRMLLALDALAIGAVAAVLILASGLVLAARGLFSPRGLALVVLAGSLAASAAGVLLLWRAVARPVEELLDAARRLGEDAALPILGEGGGSALARASVAFRRVAAELAAERRRLAAKVEELTRADRALGDAREHLVRSERLATMGRLAAGLAHEIGNPLGAVCGYAEIARARLSGDAHPDLRDAVARIADAAARIDVIVRGLLDFARPAPARIGPVAVCAAVEAAVRLARVQPRFRGVEVVLAVPPSLPPVRGDEGRLGQVLLNLLLNAGDAMGGQGRVEIAARQEADGAVELSVADAGPGIAPEHLPRLFEPFFTTKGPGEGTGLGLATSLRVVEELGGTLSAGNRAAGGAVFRLRLLPADPGGSSGSPGPPC